MVVNAWSVIVVRFDSWAVLLANGFDVWLGRVLLFLAPEDFAGAATELRQHNAILAMRQIVRKRRIIVRIFHFVPDLEEPHRIEH
jgi:hypothetical protein